MSGKTGRRLILILMFVSAAAATLPAQNLSLDAELEQEQIWLGDTVRLTLYLQGSEDEIAPELFIPGVRVEPLGGTVRSSRSVTNINGNVTETVRKAYVYAYNLTPGKTGTFIIPSIKAGVEGVELYTDELALEVKAPEINNDFSLKLEADRTRVYLDEDFRLKISFSYTKSLRTLELRIPALDSLSYQAVNDSGSSDRYEINVNGKPVVFTMHDQGDSALLSATLNITAETAGLLLFNSSTAAFESVTGYQRVRDFFGRIQRQEVYGRSVIPGNKLTVNVEPFPEKGKPADFFGLSGNISIETGIEPREVHLGDPITFRLKISGMNNTDLVIPKMKNILGYGIDVPDTRSSDEVSGNSKTVIQTIRINDDSVHEIPEIRFSYFDTDLHEYKEAASSPIPIKLLDTRIVSSADLEGVSGVKGETEQKKIITENTNEGIYYNYSGVKLLRNDELTLEKIAGSFIVRLLLVIPVFVFLIILLYTSLLPQVKKRFEARADRARALKKLRKTAKAGRAEEAETYLRVFYRELDDFLIHYCSDEEKEAIQKQLILIQSVIYGKNKISIEEAVNAAEQAVKLLSAKEAGFED